MESKKINQLATELAPELSDLTIIGDPTTGISKKITLSQMANLFTGTVEEYPNLASFPLVGTGDTIYIALDTNILYRWDTTLTSYVELSPNIVTSLVFSDANGFDGTISLVGSTATLTITTALTQGSVPFIGASGALSQDNANLFFDDTNNRLGINTNTPTTAIDAFGSGIIGRLNGTSTNNAFLGFASAGSNKWSIGNVQSDHRFRIYSEANTAELVSVLQTGEVGIGIANPLTKLHIFGGASALIANLDANTSVAKSISFRSGNSSRINLEVSGTESGSNAGADLFIRRYSDAGALIDTPLTITRSTGAITLATALNGTTATFSGDLTLDNGSADGAQLVLASSGFSNWNIDNFNGFLRAYYGSSERLRITSGGELLINATTNGVSNLGYQLGVRGTNANTQISIALANQTLSTQGCYIGLDASIGYMQMIDNKPWTFATNNVERIRINNNGNILIGTSTDLGLSAGGILQVNNAYGMSITNGGQALRFIRSGVNTFQIGQGSVTTQTGLIIADVTAGTNPIFLQQGTGNLGINSTNPGDRLVVVGANNIWAGNFIGTSSVNASFGLQVLAGTSANDTSFRCVNGAQTLEYFKIRGDGAIFTGLAALSPYNLTTASAANLVVANDSYLYRSTSSSRFKTNIEDLSINTTEILSKMRPIWYRSLGQNDRKDWSWYGFIAEELALIEPRLIHWGYDTTSYQTIEIKDEEGNIKQETKLKEDAELIPDGVQYERITVLLVAELQKMRKELDELKSLINK